jgi:hypothetical protein
LPYSLAPADDGLAAAAGFSWVSKAGGEIAGSSERGVGTVLMILTGGPGAAATGAAVAGAGMDFACGAFFGIGSAGPSTLPDQELVSAVTICAPSRLVAERAAMRTIWRLWRIDPSSAGGRR